MSQEPCTLFWPRSGFTPTPSRPMLPVAMARLAMPMHRGGALAVLGDAQSVVDRRRCRRWRTAGRRRAACAAGTPVTASMRLGRILRPGDERLPAVEALDLAAVAAAKAWLARPSVTIDVGQGVDQRHVGARAELEVVVGLDVGRVDQVDLPRVGHDEAGAFPQAALHRGGEHRVAVGRIGADDEDHVAMQRTESKFWVPADSPRVCLSPYPVGEWQTRAQVSMLLLPKAARTSFCIR